jgi:transaldolase/glucose-6-phosphate isomerase
VTKPLFADRVFAQAFEDACARLDQMAFADAIWKRDLSIWPADATAQASVATRLGWLDALDFIAPQIPRLRTFADSVLAAGFTEVVLLGMGGSSLAPEVLRQVLGSAPGYPRFRMLDSVDPEAVRSTLDLPAATLFIVASKSGSTIEPNALAAEARRRVMAAGLEWGSRAIAITDEGSSLHTRALAERWRDVFVNPSDIGGRYSALSFFGMVPAALLGTDLEGLVHRARTMADACRQPAAAGNPGLLLGAFVAAGEKIGRDKLTLLTPDRLTSLGLWVEQLVAESTGKSGRGVVPIAGEPAVLCHGEDRVGVCVQLASAPIAPPADVPTLSIDMPDALSIGAEFFRWEFATAAAGALMGVNPFDEPNVTQAKEATRRLLDLHAAQKRLPKPEAHAALEHARLTLSAAALDALNGAPATAFLRVLRRGDYLALLAYVPPDDAQLEASLISFRLVAGSTTNRPTMFGYGPRYLHSTGQLHKGGADNGVFIVVTADGFEDLGVPGESYSFGVLEQAQAIGDFQSLERAGRRALHIHLPTRNPANFAKIAAALLKE